MSKPIQYAMTDVHRIIPNPDMKQMNRVELLVDPYKGIQYNYGNLRFIDLPGGEKRISYNYEVFVNPNNLDLDNDPKFLELLNAILDFSLPRAFAKDPESAIM